MILRHVAMTRAKLKSSLVCATALVGFASFGHADELQDLKAQAAALERQNQALMQRINQIGAQQGAPGFSTAPAESQPSVPGMIGGFLTGGGTTGSSVGKTAGGSAPSVTESRVNTAATAAQTIGGTPPIPTASALTYLGVTLYGAVDTGISYQSHGTPLSGLYGPGLEYQISKNSNRSLVSLAPNALSYSNIGLRGTEPLFSDFSAVFNLQTQFIPTSGNIANNVGSIAANNGVALNRQSSNGDSTRAGQAFINSYFGVSSRTFGTLTFGRQNSLTQDAIVAYDPMYASNAFSIIGYTGAYGGGGDTEDTRLDASLRYVVNVGPIHAGAMYQVSGGNSNAPLGTNGGAGRGAYQFDVGGEFGHFDIDAVYSQVYDAVAAGALSAAQVATAPLGSVTGLISDNTAFLVAAKYKIGRLQLFLGYENLYYHNPEEPLPQDAQGINNFVLGVVNNAGYTNNKLLNTYWGGLRYAATKRLTLNAAYYRVHQSSYSGNGCVNASLPSCRGDLAGYSLLANYRITPRFDVYAGAMLSTVSDGLASGFISNTTIDPTIGARFAF